MCSANYRALLLVVQYISEFQCLQLSSPAYLDHLTKIRMKFKQVNGNLAVSVGSMIAVTVSQQAASLLKVELTKHSTATINF